MIPTNRDSDVAVHAHGCNVDGSLNGRSWQQLVWGSDTDEPTLAGRVPMAVYVAMRRKARFITFGTGASQKGIHKEAWYTYQFLIERVEPLARCLSLQGLGFIDADSLGSWIGANSFMDDESRNTDEEVAIALKRAHKYGCTEMIGVTNAFHVHRTNGYYAAAKASYGKDFLAYALASDSDVAGTVVLEPAHIPTDKRPPWHEFAAGFFRIPKDEQSDFAERLTALFSDYV